MEEPTMSSCAGYNRHGQRCKRPARSSGYCTFHDPELDPELDPKAKELAKREADGTLGDPRPKVGRGHWAGEPWLSQPAAPKIARGGNPGPGQRGLRRGPRR